MDSQTVSQLQNAELRKKLAQYGFSAGPIVPSTRRVYERKLIKLFGEQNEKQLAQEAVNGDAGAVNGDAVVGDEVLMKNGDGTDFGESVSGNETTFEEALDQVDDKFLVPEVGERKSEGPKTNKKTFFETHEHYENTENAAYVTKSCNKKYEDVLLRSRKPLRTLHDTFGESFYLEELDGSAASREVFSYYDDSSDSDVMNASMLPGPSKFGSYFMCFGISLVIAGAVIWYFLF